MIFLSNLSVVLSFCKNQVTKAVSSRKLTDREFNRLYLPLGY